MKRIIIKQAGVTKTALTDGGELIELLTDDAANASAVGNIYAGVVTQVTKGGFAFVDCGLARTAFLFLGDPREAGTRVKGGQTVAVQVLKDAAGEKGAYVTTRLSIAGRLLVVEQGGGAASVSRKIEDAGERARLKRLLSGRGVNVIARTDAARATDEELDAEFKRLAAELGRADGEWALRKAPCLLRGAAEAGEAGLRELWRADVGEVVTDDAGLYERLRGEYPGVVLYEGEDVFAEYGVARQAEKALGRRVWLKSGAFLVVERTEACAVIDVNSGKFQGKGGHEETALAVNLEAAAEVARQIRLRNFGGIIIVDFIDMEEPGNVSRLTAALRAETAKDRLKVNVVGMTELGLMQITRRRTRAEGAALTRRN